MNQKILILSITLLLTTTTFSGCIANNATAAQIKANTLQTAEDITSYTFTMDMTSTVTINQEQTSSTTTSTGTADITTQQLTMQTTIESTGISEATATYTYYLIDNIFYTKTSYSDTNTWTKIDLTDSNTDWQNQWNNYDQMAMQKQLLENSDVTKLPDQTINGHDCYVLQIDATLEELMNLLSDQLGSTTTQVEQYLSSDYIDDIHIKLYIDKNTQYIIKIYETLTMDLNMMGYQMTTNTDITLYFSNYNQPITIELPADAADATELTL